MNLNFMSVIEDPQRLNALYNLQLLDTLPEEAFDRLTDLALQTLRVPCAFISLLDHDREFLKSVRGLPQEYVLQREIPLEQSLCPYIAHTEKVLAVQNFAEALTAPWGSNPTPLGITSYLGVPLRMSSGEVLGVFAIADTHARQWMPEEISILIRLATLVITEIDLRSELIARYRNEAQLRSYTEELEQVNAELDAYGHTIAHDLKDPINVILGFAVLLQMDERVPAEAQEYVNKIISAGYSMTEMIEQLLRLAKLRNASAELVPVDVTIALQNVSTRLEAKLSLERLNYTVQEPLLPVMGHAPWVEEVFANLIANAINYADRKKPEWRVTIQCRSAPNQPDFVRYEVQDNGIGIREEDINRLFRSFSRLEAVKGIKGTGLGLSIVYRIVNRLGGQVGVESVYGEGSTFWFTLPAVRNAP